jgi:hypothetical protein
MKTLVVCACAVFALAGTAHAQVTLNSVRIAAADTVALAKFYQSAFGMQEVNRIEIPGGPKIFVNFGATVEDGSGGQQDRADSAPAVVVQAFRLAFHGRRPLLPAPPRPRLRPS